MVARWGLQCPDLQAALKRQYQRSQFEIYNHALSGSRAGNALWRITHRYPTTLDDYDAYRAEQAEQVETSQWRDSLHWCDPYLVIIESFAYANRIDGGRRFK